MGSFDGDIKKLTAEYIGGSDTTADYCCTCTVNTRIRTLGTAKAKLHNTVTFGSITYSCCFGGNQTLVVDDVEDSSFYKLGFHNRCNDFYKRLSGEHNRSFGNGINITGKLEVCQIIEKICFENA